MNPLWPWESISPQICSRRVPGAFSELGWLLSFRVGSQRDLTPGRAPDPGSQHRSKQQAGRGGSCSGRKPSNLFTLPFPLLIAVLSSLKSAADENIILLCLMPAQDIYHPVERAALLVWCRRAGAGAWLCLTQPGACWSPLQETSSLPAFPCFLCPLPLECKCHPWDSFTVGYFLKK